MEGQNLEMETIKKNMEKMQGQNEELKKNVEDMRDQMSKILSLLEKGKAVVDPVQSRQAVHSSSEDSEFSFCPTNTNQPPLQASVGGFPPQSSYNPSEHHYGSYNGKEQSQQVKAFDDTVVPNFDDPEVKKEMEERERNAKSSEKFQHLEERLRAIEGDDIFGSIDLTQLSLVPDLVIPPKFKAPEFEKFDGTTCPKSHLIMYCRKMGGYVRDNKLVIHCFQDSLTGSASRWYMQLDSAHISTWKDLADAFLKQYKYNIGWSFDRTDLQKLEMKNGESFKEYAQRWRDIATQVQPTLTNKEMIMSFVSTLKPLFSDRMIGNSYPSFADIIQSGEMIEQAVKCGKIIEEKTESSSVKRFPSKKREGDVHIVERGNRHPREESHTNRPNHYSNGYTQPFINNTSYQYPSIPSQNPGPITTQAYQPRPQFTPRTQDNRRPYVHFDPIPISYTELLPQLFENRKLAPVPMKTMQPPYPKWYNPNAHCDYHSRAQGHSTENCTALKYKVQDMIDAGWLNFKKADVPNINNNPLPNHGIQGVNAIISDEDDPKKDVGEITIPMGQLFEILLKNEYIQMEYLKPDCEDRYNGDETCIFHAGAKGHSIQHCCAFRKRVQNLMDLKWLIITQKKERNTYQKRFEVGTIEDCGGVFNGSKPLTIIYHDTCIPNLVSKPISIPVPGSFPFKDLKAVPWKYECTSFAKSEIEPFMVDNITGVGGLTRSGRCYTPDVLRKEEAIFYHKGKAKMKEDDRLTEEGNRKNIPLSEEESQEFLKLIKQSEYKVVEQMNQTPAKISILSLLLYSEAHRKALLEALNEAYVARDISVSNLNEIVGNLTSYSTIAFTDAEVPPNGYGSTKALHISVKCKGYVVAKVLIDNGSSLNVMPKSTLEKLPIDMSHIKHSKMIVRAFDGARSEVIGEIEIPIQIGPCTFNIVFQVMNISSAYSMLLGRPWIHSAGVVPSSLHQKLKFIVDHKLICVSGEDDFLISKPDSMPYVEAAEEALECSFRSFEVATTTSWIEETKNVKLGMFSLNKNSHCLEVLLKLKNNNRRFGLGYKPSRADVIRAQEEDKEKRMARFENRELKSKNIIIPPLYKSFISAGMIYSERQALCQTHFTVAAITKDEEEMSTMVYPCPEDTELNNWKMIELPSPFYISK